MGYENVRVTWLDGSQRAYAYVESRHYSDDGARMTLWFGRGKPSVEVVLANVKIVEIKTEDGRGW